jgi:glutathione S-transferase
VKLYDSPGAPNPRRVKIYLAEKGIEVPIEEVSIPKGEHRQEPFLAKNSLGQLPILELDDGSVIAESAAICRYFEETHPEPPLLGTDAVDRARVAMWDRRMEFQLFIPYAQVFRNTHEFWKGRIPQVPEWGEVNRKAVTKALAWLDGELADRKFIAGDRYTVADITAQCAFDFFGRILKLKPPPEQKHLTRWYEAVSARPSAQA